METNELKSKEWRHHETQQRDEERVERESRNMKHALATSANQLNTEIGSKSLLLLLLFFFRDLIEAAAQVNGNVFIYKRYEINVDH